MSQTKGKTVNPAKQNRSIQDGRQKKRNIWGEAKKKRLNVDILSNAKRWGKVEAYDSEGKGVHGIPGKTWLGAGPRKKNTP